MDKILLLLGKVQSAFWGIGHRDTEIFIQGSKFKVQFKNIGVGKIAITNSLSVSFADEGVL